MLASRGDDNLTSSLGHPREIVEKVGDIVYWMPRLKLLLQECYLIRQLTLDEIGPVLSRKQ